MYQRQGGQGVFERRRRQWRRWGGWWRRCAGRPCARGRGSLARIECGFRRSVGVAGGEEEDGVAWRRRRRRQIAAARVWTGVRVGYLDGGSGARGWWLRVWTRSGGRRWLWQGGGAARSVFRPPLAARGGAARSVRRAPPAAAGRRRGGALVPWAAAGCAVRRGGAVRRLRWDKERWSPSTQRGWPPAASGRRKGVAPGWRERESVG